MALSIPYCICRGRVRVSDRFCPVGGEWAGRENKQKEGGGRRSRWSVVKSKQDGYFTKSSRGGPTSLPKVMHYLSNLEGEQKHQGEFKQFNNIGVNFRVA